MPGAVFGPIYLRPVDGEREGDVRLGVLLLCDLLGVLQLGDLLGVVRLGVLLLCDLLGVVRLGAILL